MQKSKLKPLIQRR